MFAGRKIPGFVIAAICFFASGAAAFAQRNAHEPKPVPMKLPPAATNIAPWHCVHFTPKTNLPPIHFYNKLNPIWWVQNADEPTPPKWYRPDDPHRETKWSFRNPFHNFCFYVIGVADKKIVRCGRYPERNSNPNGGWNVAITRRILVLLPFVSYERKWITFYLGWRERGAFGAELRIHRKPKPKAEESQPPETPPVEGAK